MSEWKFAKRIKVEADFLKRIEDGEVTGSAHVLIACTRLAADEDQRAEFLRLAGFPKN
jgi:hypothetical protein